MSYSIIIYICFNKIRKPPAFPPNDPMIKGDAIFYDVNLTI